VAGRAGSSSGPHTAAELAYATRTGRPASRAASNTLSVPIRFTIAPATGCAWQNGISTAARCTTCVMPPSRTSAFSRAVSSTAPVSIAARRTCSGGAISRSRAGSASVS
jgi:hypothetical protein